jgi:anti-sigma-K factor RskA
MSPLILSLAPLLIDALRRRLAPATGTMGGASATAIPDAVNAAIKEAAKTPEIQNATNSEPLWRSRVVNGSVGAILAAFAALVAQLVNGSFDLTSQETLLPLGAVLAAGYALFGRVTSGLKPMWSRTFGGT